MFVGKLAACREDPLLRLQVLRPKITCWILRCHGSFNHQMHSYSSNIQPPFVKSWKNILPLLYLGFLEIAGGLGQQNNSQGCSSDNIFILSRCPLFLSYYFSFLLAKIGTSEFTLKHGGKGARSFLGSKV